MAAVSCFSPQFTGEIVMAAAPNLKSFTNGQCGSGTFKIHKPDQQLPRGEIIKSKLVFQTLFENGVHWQGKHLRIIYEECDQRQVAFAVSKRLGKAVLRNRMKRLMREAYRRHRSDLENIRLIMIARIASTKIKNESIERELLVFIKERSAA